MAKSSLPRTGRTWPALKWVREADSGAGIGDGGVGGVADMLEVA